NPDGVDPKIFDQIKEQIEKDRFDFLMSFGKVFYNDKLLSHSVSDGKLQADFVVASQANYRAMLFCVDAWLEDFREDVRQIKVPTLVIHGDADQVIPLKNSGGRMPELIPGAKLHVIENGPHGLIWTHADEVNKTLLAFLQA
ncbi:MAG: alpha/beta fold hydrolase, partial [Janthinobacterium lividum]